MPPQARVYTGDRLIHSDSVDPRPAISYLVAMAIRDILTIPDPLLRERCTPVDTVDDTVRKLLDDMLETMYDAPGIGLAASQIGVMQRAVVIDTSSRKAEGEDGAEIELPGDPLFLVNPEITWVSKDISVYQEGCLSIPEYFEDVERPAEIKVRFLGRDGKPEEMHCDGLLATVVQHEVDHLNGVLFIDHISKLKRDGVWKKFAKAKKRGEAA